MWRQIKPKKETKVYQLNDEPITIHVITVRKNEYIVVHVTGYDKQDEKVEFHTKESLLEKYNIKIKPEFKTYKGVVLFEFGDEYDIENVLKCINILNKKVETLGVLYGECFTSMNIPFDVMLSNASHTIFNLNIIDNKVVGDIKILDTNMGESVQNVIDAVGIDNMLIKPRLMYASKPDEIDFEITEIFTFDFYTL